MPDFSAQTDQLVGWLTANGVAANRLEEIGYGETKPKFDNKKDDGRKLNRRVEIQTK